MSKYDDYAVELAVLSLRKLADRMEEDAVFAREILDEAKALRDKKVKEAKKQSQDLTVNSLRLQSDLPNTKIRFKKGSPDDLPDIYAIYMEGKEEGLRGFLEEYDVDDLKRIVSKNHLDPSGKVRRWKPKPKIINFIVETTMKRMSQGDAFKTE